jgi:uncharacterized protein YciI
MLLMTEFKTCRAMEDECLGNYNVAMRRLFTVMINHGAGWRDGRPLEEQVEWDAHASFMDKLVEEEFVLLGGPLEGTSEVLLIVRAESLEEIKQRLAPDPWHKMDLLRVARITPWILRLGSLPDAERIEGKV